MTYVCICMYIYNMSMNIAFTCMDVCGHIYACILISAPSSSHCIHAHTNTVRSCKHKKKIYIYTTFCIYIPFFTNIYTTFFTCDASRIAVCIQLLLVCIQQFWCLHERTNKYTEWWRRTQCLVCIGHFPWKSPIISGSFAERDWHLNASYASATLYYEVATMSRLLQILGFFSSNSTSLLQNIVSFIGPYLFHVRGTSCCSVYTNIHVHIRTYWWMTAFNRPYMHL